MKKVTKPNPNSSVGERIKYIRTKQGLSQEQLGDEINRNRVEVAYFENGNRNIDSQTLKAIAKALKVPTDYLCGLNDIESYDISTQAINDLIGLESGSILRLSRFKNIEEDAKGSLEDYELAGIENEKLKLAMVNKLLSSNIFEEVLQLMVDYEDVVNKIKKQPTEMAFQRDRLKGLEEKKDTIEYRITKKMVSILNNENGC